MQADPEGTIRFLAQQYGVDLGSNAGPELGTEQEATLQQYQQTLQNLYAKQQQGFAQEWYAFTRANPQAAGLRQRIGVELSLRPQEPGESVHQALARGFEAVKWADPQIRQSLLDADQKAKDAERQRKADLDKAKKSGRVVQSRSTPGSDARVPGRDWKEELERAWDQASA